MPCTIGAPSPARRAAATLVWIGLWSPVTAAKPRRSVGAVTVTARLAGVVASRSATGAASRIGELAGAGTSADREALTQRGDVSSRREIVTSTATTRPKPVSSIDVDAWRRSSARRATAAGAGQRDAWSRWTRSSMPSMRRAGEDRRPGEPDEHVGNLGWDGGGWCAPVTPAWSAIRSGPGRR